MGSRETARPLATPDELRRLGAGEQVLLVRGSQPALVRRIAFYADPVFGPRSRGNGPT
jgi:type IV secretion system protein VirD4